MKKEQVKQFVKNHKKEILTGIIVAAVGGSAYAIGKGHGVEHGIHKGIYLSDMWLNNHKNDTEWVPGFWIEGGITVGDIGKLGEEFMKHDETLTKETGILEVGKFVFDYQ